jgi:predicted DNA-binding ribbon-helix-helix protein
MNNQIKRSISIQGHRTSVSLELEFWDVLKSMAAQRNQSIAQLIAEVDKARGQRNLSSAIRVYILQALKLKD